MVFLQSHGVGTGHAVRIYQQYGEEAIHSVRQDPYRLQRDVRGIGFQTADRIAGDLGIAHDAPERVRAACGPLATLVERKYFLDKLAETVVVRWALHRGVGRLAHALDRRVVDGLVNGSGRLALGAGDAVRRAQSGQLQAATSMLLAGVVAAAVLLYVFAGEVLAR